MVFRFFVVFAAVISLVWVSSDAVAQNRSDRYTIIVKADDGTCRYQIRNQANQDLFVIAPGGVVSVLPRGDIWVDVAVEDDLRGTPGTQNERSMALRQADESRALMARGDIGRSTEHKVRIECCPERRGRNECPRWVEAQPPSVSMGSMGIEPVGIDAGMPLHGPSAGDTPRPALPAGGPIMRVEEN